MGLWTLLLWWNDSFVEDFYPGYRKAGILEKVLYAMKVRHHNSKVDIYPHRGLFTKVVVVLDLQVLQNVSNSVASVHQHKHHKKHQTPVGVGNKPIRAKLLLHKKVNPS